MNRNFEAMSNLFHKDNDSSSDIFHSWSYDKENYILFAAGMLAIILGYILMGTGETYSFQSLSIAPVFLFIGYLVLIPLSLTYKKNKKE